MSTLSRWPARPWKDGELLIRLRERLRARKAAALAASLILVGCSFTQGTRTAPDGSKLTVRNTRFLWASEGVTFGVTDTNGFRVDLSIRKSRPDIEAIGAVAEGVAKGMAQGVKP